MDEARRSEDGETRSNDISERHILYDLLEITEWPEITNILDTEKGLTYLWRKIASSVYVFLRNSLDKIRHPIRYLSFNSPSVIVKLLNAKLPWKLSITSDGLFLAVLRDDVIEIRSLLDGFNRVNTTVPVGKDCCPQWRQLQWSEERYVLALASSGGEVHVLSLDGKSLGRVGRVSSEESGRNGYEGSLSRAVAELLFIPPQDRHSQDVLALLNVLFYDGSLETYEIRSDSPPVHLHSFSFSRYFLEGVSTMTYVGKHNLLLVGGSPHSNEEGVACGVSGWRLLDAPPYWGPRLGQQIHQRNSGFLSQLYSKRKGSHKLKGIVLRMCVSPSASLLATIDLSGQLSLWDVPSLRHRATFEPSQLPVRQERGAKKGSGAPVPLEVTWWTDEALVLVNEFGEVSILSTSSLKDLLGNSPLSGWSVTPTYSQQFFLLKCDVSQKGVVKKYRIPSLSVNAEEEQAEDQDEEGQGFSLSRFSSELLKQVLYFVTDNDRFLPESRKKLKYQAITRKYSLACMKAISPAEYYERKLLSGDYEEALDLAREYELDSDLVHQRQWDSYQVSARTIQDYLAKVSRLWWVLQECVSRPTSDFATTRHLLSYGLSRTSFRELKDMADLKVLPSGGVANYKEEEGEGSGTREEHDSQAGGSDDGDNATEEVQEEGLEEILQVMRDIEELSDDQTSLCQYRHTFLCYLDRLDTYQAIASASDDDDALFNWKKYEAFRSENLVASAIAYARDSNWKALEVLFIYHGDVILPHRLAILSNFPETTPPNSYVSLLPDIDSDGSLKQWEQEEHRVPDWVESEVTRKLCSLPNDRRGSYGDFIYDGNSHWLPYLRARSMECVKNWYMSRAAEIEEYSGQVDSALSLVELACENGVTGMGDALHELRTLYTLVYECGADSRLSWKKLKSLSDLEVIQLMLKETDVSEFVRAMEARMVPFLARLEGVAPHRSRGLLKDYMRILSKGNLVPCLKILQQSNEVLDRGDGDGRALYRRAILPSSRERMDMAVTCILACDRSDQLGVANEIIVCLPTRESDSPDSSDLHDLVDTLENYISAAGILEQYKVHKPIGYIKSMQESSEVALQLLVKLTRVASRRTPAMTEANWKILLGHLLSLRKSIFSFIDVATCYKIYTESLLCSGEEANIQLAVRHLSLDPSLPDPPTYQPLVTGAVEEMGGRGLDMDEEEVEIDFKLSYDLSQELVIGAAREYFNSAANLMDKDMDLARSCLCLFPYPGQEVQSELNLIASLALLDDFSVSMLPVQVRLSENKLDIVRNILDSSPSAYKRHDKIVRLCQLLESNEGKKTVGAVSGGEVDQGGSKMGAEHGCALILIVLAALQKKDFRLALELSRQLMAAQFQPAWEVCRVMGLQPQVADMETRKRLLDFSITHCPPEEMVSLLQSRKLLYIQSQLHGCGIPDGKSTGPAAHPPGGGVALKEEERRGLGLVGKSVKLVSLGAGAVQSWMSPGYTDTSSSSGRVGGGAGDVEKEVEQVVRESAERLRDHVTRLEEQRRTLTSRSVLPSSSCHRFYYRKRKVKRVGGEEVTEKLVLSLQNLLHFNQLALGLTSYSEQCHTISEICTEVLLKLAELCSGQDIHLTLGYLLELRKGEDLEVWLSKVSSSQFSLEFFLYCVAFQLYTVTISPSGLRDPDPLPSDMYYASPAKFLNHVASSVKSCDLGGGWSMEQEPWITLLKKYQRMLEDHNQTETLLDLGLGIDVDQFSTDEDYRRTIITSLARSSDQKVFSTALSQARRHGVDLWEVHMSLLESLLTTGRSSSSGDVEKKLKEHNVLPCILKSPQRSLDYLQDTVYPQLSGCRLDRLLLYYTTVRQCRLSLGPSDKADSDVHITVLTKLLEARVQGVDYKLLMAVDKDPLMLLLPALSSSNVHTVAGIARDIPCGQGATLTQGMVLCAYALKLFWTSDKGSSTSRQSKQNWMKKFDRCKEYLQVLSPVQFQHFVLGVAASRKSLQLPVEARCQLVKVSIQFVQGNVLYDAPTAAGLTKDKRLSQEELVALLNKYLRHLRNVKDRLARHDDPNISEEKWQKFKIEFDLSMSEKTKVKQLVQEMVRCGASPETVDKFLQCAGEVEPDQCLIATLYQETLHQVLASAANKNDTNKSTSPSDEVGPADEPDHPVPVEKQEMGQEVDSSSVKRIFAAISDHETGGGSLVSSRDLVAILTPFCKDKATPLHLRRLWFSFMEQHLFLSEEDHHLLLCHHSQSLLESDFPVEVTVSDVSTAAGQRKLFAGLLESCKTKEQRQALCSLLECWSEAWSVGDLMDCWLDLMELLATTQDPGSFEEVLCIRAGLVNVSVEADEKLVSYARDSVLALKYSLLCDSSLFDGTLKGREIEVPAEEEADEDLMELLLLKKKVLQLRSTKHPLYNQLRGYVQSSSPRGPRQRRLFVKLLGCSDSELEEQLGLADGGRRVKEFARQLHGGGFTVEAGALLLRASGFHRELATVTDSLAFVRNMFSS